MKQGWSSALACGVLLSCAGAPGAKAPEPAAPVASATPAVVVKQPSAEVSRYWTFAQEPPFTLYADVGALTRTELMTGLLPLLLQQAGGALSEAQRGCVNAVLGGAGELVMGAGDGHGLVVVELGEEGVKAARSACVGAVLPRERSPLAGTDEAYAGGEDVVAVLPGGVVLFGLRSLVEAALAPGAKPAPLPAHFTLSGDQQAAFRFDLAERNVSAHGALSLTKERFLLRGQFQLPSDAAAEALDKGLAARTAQVRQSTRGSGAEATIAKLLGALKLERQGRSFNVHFELRGSPSEQAHDLGVLAAMSASAVERYLANAKLAEAKNTLGQITKSYQAALLPAEGQKSKLPRKLQSLPKVPATVPRGERQQTNAEDWKAWAPIGFMLAEPQYFQYEVVAAKDGKTAQVLARGDLNGDGKTSLLSLTIQLDAKTGQLTAQGLDESEPFE